MNATVLVCLLLSSFSSFLFLRLNSFYNAVNCSHQDSNPEPFPDCFERDDGHVFCYLILYFAVYIHVGHLS